jgi:hypothetical protein
MSQIDTTKSIDKTDETQERLISVSTAISELFTNVEKSRYTANLDTLLLYKLQLTNIFYEIIDLPNDIAGAKKQHLLEICIEISYSLANTNDMNLAANKTINPFYIFLLDRAFGLNKSSPAEQFYAKITALSELIGEAMEMHAVTEYVKSLYSRLLDLINATNSRTKIELSLIEEIETGLNTCANKLQAYTEILGCNLNETTKTHLKEAQNLISDLKSQIEQNDEIYAETSKNRLRIKADALKPQTAK